MALLRIGQQNFIDIPMTKKLTKHDQWFKLFGSNAETKVFELNAVL